MKWDYSGIVHSFAVTMLFSMWVLLTVFAWVFSLVWITAKGLWPTVLRNLGVRADR
jgi:hypothetical protein